MKVINLFAGPFDLEVDGSKEGEKILKAAALEWIIRDSA